MVKSPPRLFRSFIEYFKQRPKVLLTLAFAGLCFQNCLGQSANLPTAAEASRINNIIPPAPTAVSLGTYGNYPVKGFDGIPNIEVPLLNLQLKGFNLPISMSYNATGVKVADIGSWVGQGWSTNFGGLVTRSVVDEPDDYNGISGVGRFGTGFLKYNYDQPGLNPRTEDQIGCTNGFRTGPYAIDYDTSSDSWMAFTISDIKGQHMDTEPDIFYYNFNGNVGKFVFNAGSAPGSHKIMLIPYRDLKMEYSLDASGYLGGFTITDEQGNKYYFQTTEQSIVQSGGYSFTKGVTLYRQPSNNIKNWTRTFTSSWYVTKIETALKETINFTYADEIYSYNYPTNFSFKNSPFADPAQDVDVQGNNLTRNDFGQNFGDYEGSQSVYTIRGKRLSSIESESFKVDFIGDHNRLDIVGSHALTAIKYYSKVGGNLSLLKEFDLNYHYMSGSENPNWYNVEPILPQNGDSGQHLLLSNIQCKDSQLQNISSYAFNYYGEGDGTGGSSLPLPDRLSYQTDFWGYYNKNNAKIGIPKLYFYPDHSGQPSIFAIPNLTPNFVFPGANKNTDALAILSGTLKRISFPTGGSTDFIFEPHTFRFENQNITGGGLRLQKSIAYDGIDHLHDVVKSYRYVDSQDATKSSGVLFSLPEFSYLEFFPFPRGKVEPQYLNMIVDQPTYYKYDLVRSDIARSTLGEADGIVIGYREISEINSDGSKIIRKYSVPGSYIEDNDIPVTQLDSDDDPMGSCDINFSGFCDGYFEKKQPKWLGNFDIIRTSCPVTLDDFGASSTLKYPFAPNTNYDWNRGILLTESLFDNLGHLKRDVNYKYTLYTPGNLGPQFVKGLRYATLHNDGAKYVGYRGQEEELYAQVISQYKLITQIVKVPISEQQKDYDISGNALTTTKTYSYNFKSLNPSTEETDHSDGTSIVVNHKYVTDFDLSQSSTLPDYLGYQSLQNNHINALVEDVIQKRNADNTLITIGASQTTYKPDVPLPSVSYISKSPQPLSNFTPLSISPATIVRDNSYEKKQTVDLYDSQKNMVQLTQGVATQAYLWGYNGQYLIASVNKASNSSIAYTSFESSDSGHWKYTGNNLADGTAPTGKNVYNLAAGNIYADKLDAGNTYVVAYYSKNGAQTVTGSTSVKQDPGNNGWTYYEHSVVLPANFIITVSGTGTIDELRLYPQGAQMTTYTYDPLIGMTSKTDANNTTSYYEYDGFQRLKYIRNYNKDIVKTYDYHYKL